MANSLFNEIGAKYLIFNGCNGKCLYTERNRFDIFSWFYIYSLNTITKQSQQKKNRNYIRNIKTYNFLLKNKRN